MQVALAWLLRRAPNILLIPGTSSLAHLRENPIVAELARALTSPTVSANRRNARRALKRKRLGEIIYINVISKA
jgi:aryl-alcohol dehydrogenase-like predicted oxidoreductase